MSHTLTGLAMILAAASGALLAGCIGWKAGRESGYLDGREAGHAEGRDEGHAEGRDEGYADGYADGHADGARIGRAGALMKAQAALDALTQPEGDAS